MLLVDVVFFAAAVFLAGAAFFAVDAVLLAGAAFFAGVARFVAVVALAPVDFAGFSSSTLAAAAAFFADFADVIGVVLNPFTTSLMPGSYLTTSTGPSVGVSLHKLQFDVVIPLIR